MEATTPTNLSIQSRQRDNPNESDEEEKNETMSSGSLEVEMIEPLPIMRRPSSLHHPETNQNLAENSMQR